MNPVGPVIYKRVRKDLNHVLIVGMEHTKIISIILVVDRDVRELQERKLCAALVV
jgi:hypothetical protein